MKIAYFVSGRPEFVQRLPEPFCQSPLILATGADGLYAPDTLEKVADVEAFIVSNEPITEQILAAAPHLKIVQRLGVGYEKLDLEAAAKRNIPCCNLPGVNKEAVAEHHMMFLLALHRNFIQTDAVTRSVAWEQARITTGGSSELMGKTIGIIGLGNTGYELARRAWAFGMKVLYHDIKAIPAEKTEAIEAESVNKNTLLERADIVSVAVDLNPTSENLMDRAAFALMKQGAYFTCCARGGVVDETALTEALNTGNLAGAGMDVFSAEPFGPENPMLKAKNLMMTPHMGGVTIEANQRMFDWAHENAERVIVRKEKPLHVLNGV